MLDPQKAPVDSEIKEEISELDKLINSDSEIEKKPEETKNIDENIIFNININSIEDLIKISSEKGYDLLIMEGMEKGKALITFKLENVEKEKVYIQYPIYSKILFKIKLETKLNVEEINKSQEGKGEFNMNGKIYNLYSKTIPDNLGEKIYFSAILGSEVSVNKKSNIGQFIWFLGIIFLIILLLGGAFLTFTVLKAKTVDDVKFFFNLGINLSAINRFIINLSNTIFGLIIFASTLFTIIYFFKFFLTKKENKKRRIMMTILWIFFFLLSFIILAGWIVVYKLLLDLPNWQDLSYGYVQLYDNDKLLLNKTFTKENSLIKDTKNLIGPVTIKYDLTFLAKRESDKGFQIKNYLWGFDGSSSETLNPTIIRKFDKEGTIKTSLIVEGFDQISGKTITKTINEIPPINIINLVKVTEETRPSGGKVVQFDASNLKDLGDIEWYKGDNFTTPIWEGLKYNPFDLIFDKTIILMKVKNNYSGDKETINKIFVVGGVEQESIEGEISYEKNPENDIEYKLSVKNIKNSKGNGYIINYEWNIGNNIMNKSGKVENQEKASEITYRFPTYGEQEVRVKLKDSSGKEKELVKVIKVQKSIELSEILRFYENEEELYVKYNGKTYEYFLNKLLLPTVIRINASGVKSKDFRYFLKNIGWDLNNDGKIDKVGQILDYPVDIEGSHLVGVFFNFINKKTNDIIEVKENIYIEGIKKESQLDLKMDYDTNYAPVIVRFDASRSQVKNEDIVRFVYDYGDGVVEERDSINQGHRYLKNGEYTVKLTVTTATGKDYSIKKQLVLKPQQEKAIITTSLKKAPILQGIDFSSSKSIGQINGYFWDFGDGENSIEANPTHSYSRAGTYKVNLKLDLASNNSTTDAITITIE